MKRKPGRPKFPDELRRDSRINVTVTRRGKIAIESAARAADMPVSHWIEAVALRRDDGK